MDELGVGGCLGQPPASHAPVVVLGVKPQVLPAVLAGVKELPGPGIWLFPLPRDLEAWRGPGPCPGLGRLMLERRAWGGGLHGGPGLGSRPSAGGPLAWPWPSPGAVEETVVVRKN